MICPLMKAEIAGITTQGECFEKECAWWCEEFNGIMTEITDSYKNKENSTAVVKNLPITYPAECALRRIARK
jgi:hypothetical protein